MMDNLLQHHESLIRLSCFVGLLVLFAVLEHITPQRRRHYSRLKRWPQHITLLIISTLLIRLVVPITAVSTAILADHHGWGLFNTEWLNDDIALVIISLLILDLCIYWQHRCFHRYPILWRLHKVHHADPDLDITTALRFHPLEMLVSAVIKCGIVLLVGIPVSAVILFEIILNGMAMFNHANLRIHPTIERAIRKIWITPDLHVIHHSSNPQETNSNFGFNLSIWDRCFKTLRETLNNPGNTIIGLKDYPSAHQSIPLSRLLFMPFEKSPKP